MPRFLCCLPLSVGVWLFSLLFFAWGTVLTVIGWYGVAQYEQTDLALTRRQLVSLIITTSSWTLQPLITLFGMGAALARSPRALKAYSTALWFQFGFSVGAGAYFLYNLYRRNNGNFVTNCTSRNIADQDTCQQAFNVLRGVIVAVYIVIWLIEIWGGVIVTQYATERFESSGFQFTNAPLAQAPGPVVLDPVMMPPPEPPILGPAPPGRFAPNASGRFTPPGGQPQPAFVPTAGGVTLPPIIPINETGPQAPYAFAMPQNAHGAANQV